MKASDSCKIQADSNSKSLLTDANLHIIFSLLPILGNNGIFFICAALALVLIGFVFVVLE